MKSPGKYKTLSDTRQYRGPGGTAPKNNVMKKPVVQAEMPPKNSPMIGRPAKRGK